MPYATTEQLLAVVSSNRLEHRVAGNEAEKQATYALLLSSASGQMDEAFERGGYSAPIDPSAAGSRSDQVRDMLAICCVSVALGDVTIQTPGDDAPINEASTKWSAWLDGVGKGLRLIPGIAKAADELGDRSAGRAAFVASGELSQPERLDFFNIQRIGLVF